MREVIFFLSDHLVQFLDYAVCTLYFSDGLKFLELVFVLDYLVLVLYLGHFYLHVIFLIGKLLFPSKFLKTLVIVPFFNKFLKFFHFHLFFAQSFFGFGQVASQLSSIFISLFIIALKDIVESDYLFLFGIKMTQS